MLFYIFIYLAIGVALSFFLSEYTNMEDKIAEECREHIQTLSFSSAMTICWCAIVLIWPVFAVAITIDLYNHFFRKSP